MPKHAPVKTKSVPVYRIVSQCRRYAVCVRNALGQQAQLMCGVHNVLVMIYCNRMSFPRATLRCGRVLQVGH